VNTAARVQTEAEPGTVLVDEITRQVTSAAIAYEDAGDHELKGKEAPVRLWRPTRVVSGAGGKQREQGLDAPLIGRDADLRLVKDLFHAGVDRGVARLVAISGPAGVGKTRLNREFENYTDGLATEFFYHAGRCLPYGEGVAYWALAEMIRQRFGIAEEATADDASAKLTAGLERWILDPADREFLVPRLGALLGVAEPGLARDELFAGWRMFFERLAEHDPVVLVFEDVQWADEGLLDFIDHLLDWSTDKPIFMLAMARPELAERRAEWPGTRRGATAIHLEPLADDAIGELLDELVLGLPAEAKARIVSQAEGIPLYAIETIRALADRGVLVKDGEHLVLAGELGELDIPASLSSLLAARLDALEPEERDLVRTMSVFGGAFPRASAAVLSGVPEAHLDSILESLVR
jgi:predicted ATPase